MSTPPQSAKSELETVYSHRFSSSETSAKDQLWVEIAGYLQRFITPSQPVLDVACDRGDFIRNIDADEKWATDMRDVSSSLPVDVKFVMADGPKMANFLPHNHFGSIFMSNYLEHLPSGQVVLEQLRSAHEVACKGGRVIILQPNIRLVGASYWDFLDHEKALTERSLIEAAEAAGFVTQKVITRFLPFTTKSRLPQSRWLVRSYLKFRPVWFLLGKQTLYVGKKP